MIIALGLMLVVGVQSCTVYLGGSVLEHQRTSEGGALGLFMALLFLVGGAFALPFPLISLLTFLVAGLLGLAAGATTPFTDLTVWGIVALVLSGLSFLGVREKRRRRAEHRSGT